ncbi:unnamed protein product [Caenorhabditis brenneri]
MSLSRPAKLPILKLPFLCIKDVVKSWDIFDIICFAIISQKTRRIVKNLKIPLNGIEISLSDQIWIQLDGSLRKRKWYFRKENKPESKRFPRRTDDILESYTDGDEVTALKLVMEFLNEAFKCSIENFDIDADNFPESGDIGVKSTMNLYITNHKSQSLSYAQKQKLNLLLENLEVTETCTFYVKNTENGFYVDPKLFKCKELMFFKGTAAWVTLEILLQFDVPRFTFLECLFSVEDILSFVTNWFHSDNKKLEYLYIPYQCQTFSLETFRTTELNPVPFRGGNRVPVNNSIRYVDFSKGLEIVRHDGLQATIHVAGENFMFHIWHNQ